MAADAFCIVVMSNAISCGMDTWLVRVLSVETDVEAAARRPVYHTRHIGDVEHKRHTYAQQLNLEWLLLVHLRVMREMSTAVVMSYNA